MTEEPLASRDRPARLGTLLALGVLAAIAVVLRRPADLLHHPFWADESWVANSVRVPFGSLRAVTATSPIGFSALLRLVPGADGNERLRLVPLVFSVAALVPAYLLGRAALGTRRAGMVLAAVCACAPALLVHRDLKQYSSDAFVAVLCLWLLARADERRRARDVWLLVAVLSVAGLISHVAWLVGVAAVGALLVASLRRRELRQVLGPGVLLAVSFAATYLVFDRYGHTSALDVHWRASWPPSGAGAALRWTYDALVAALGRTGLHPAVALVAVIVGVATLALRHRTATAAFLPLLLVELWLAAALHQYPFLDDRTSTFVSVLLLLMAALGVLGLVERAWRRSRPAAFVVALAALADLSSGVQQAARSTLTLEDVRAQVAYLRSHRVPGEPVVVNYSDSNNYLWYAGLTFTPERSHAFTTLSFYPRLTDVPDVQLPIGATQGELCKALRAALDLPDRPSPRVWIVGARPAGRALAALATGYGEESRPLQAPGTALVLLTVARSHGGACG